MCYFNLADLASPDTGMVKIDPKLVNSINNLIIHLDQYRDYFTITSGYRTPKHNKKVGGVKNSFHMRGIAIDCYAKPLSHEHIAERALKCGFTTAIVYKSHVHLDIREKGLGLRRK